MIGYPQVKRLIDALLAGVGLLVTGPVCLVVAALVRARMGSPVLFRQERLGRHGEPFHVVKFRTMLDVDPARGLVADADRLTPFGQFLRATSLDELPTLWNVLRGQMSLVGPRPLPTRYRDRYSPTQWRRHEVRPGVTGLAQIRGRNGLSWTAKFDSDVEYVDHCGPALDFKIIMGTFRLVLRREGISAEGCATAHEFLGDGARVVPGRPR